MPVVETDCNPTPPEHEVKLEESKEEVSPAVIHNQVVHMEPMEIEVESNETMIVLLENISEQPNHAYEHGENNLGSPVLEMSKVAIPDTNERLVFQNPLEGEPDFVEGVELSNIYAWVARQNLLQNYSITWFLKLAFRNGLRLRHRTREWLMTGTAPAKSDPELSQGRNEGVSIKLRKSACSTWYLMLTDVSRWSFCYGLCAKSELTLCSHPYQFLVCLAQCIFVIRFLYALPLVSNEKIYADSELTSSSQFRIQLSLASAICSYMHFTHVLPFLSNAEKEADKENEYVECIHYLTRSRQDDDMSDEETLGSDEYNTTKSKLPKDFQRDFKFSYEDHHDSVLAMGKQYTAKEISRRVPYYLLKRGVYAILLSDDPENYLQLWFRYKNLGRNFSDRFQIANYFTIILAKFSPITRKFEHLFFLYKSNRFLEHHFHWLYLGNASLVAQLDTDGGLQKHIDMTLASAFETKAGTWLVIPINMLLSDFNELLENITGATKGFTPNTMNAIFFPMDTFLEQGNPIYGEAINHPLIFFVSATWILAGIVLSNAYRGDNICELTAPISPTKPTTFEQLVNKNFVIITHSDGEAISGIISGFLKGSDFFMKLLGRNNTNEKHFANMLSTILEDQYEAYSIAKKYYRVLGIVKKFTVDESFKVAKQGTSGFVNMIKNCSLIAFMSLSDEIFQAKMLLENILYSEERHDDIKFVSRSKEDFLVARYGWSISSVTILTTELTRNLAILVESGIRTEWKIVEKFVKNFNATAQFHSKSRIPRALSLKGNVPVIFFVHVALLSLSTITFLLEQDSVLWLCKNKNLKKGFVREA
ncbi:unnamed protein product [Orchesella dallaii]|uniref:Uncharacterized protein n=1 Tax=Orchesella dallaii TaxID=48710 RepID=A0ABP1RK47_9HEXA